MQLKIISIKAKKKVSKTYSKGKEKVCYILYTLTETIFNPVFWLQTQSQGCVREKDMQMQMAYFIHHLMRKSWNRYQYTDTSYGIPTLQSSYLKTGQNKANPIKNKSESYCLWQISLYLNLKKRKKSTWMNWNGTKQKGRNAGSRGSKRAIF